MYYILCVPACTLYFYSGLGEYVEILRSVLRKDLHKFLVAFAIVTISFGGGLYFALVGEPCPLNPTTTTGMGFDPVQNSSLCLFKDETR